MERAGQLLGESSRTGDGVDDHQADLATKPQCRTRLPRQRKRQGCSKSCGLGRALPAGWSTHHQEVPLPIEENPMKSSICTEVPCPAPPFLVGLLGWTRPDHCNLGYLCPPALVRTIRQLATPKSHLWYLPETRDHCLSHLSEPPDLQLTFH